MKVEIIIQIVSTILALIAILTTLYLTSKEIKNNNKNALEQARNAFYADYTRRYQDIILGMPDDVFMGTAEVNPRTMKYMQLYFGLCSEEYNLYIRGLIPEDIWENWKEGMCITVRMRLYMQCWRRSQGIYNQDFYNFFEREVLPQNRE